MSSNRDFLHLIRQFSSQQIISAGTQLFRQDDPIREIYLLEKGLVKFMRTEMNGQEMLVEIRSAGGLLGAASALANHPAPMSVVTLTPCEVCHVSTKDFLHLENTNAAFSHELLVSISRRRNEQGIRQSHLGLFPARVRLAQLLLQLMRDFGVERHGQLQLALPISKQDIAAYLAITPQRLSNIFREMKREGLIAEEKDWITLSDRLSLTSEATGGQNIRARLAKGRTEI